MVKGTAFVDDVLKSMKTSDHVEMMMKKEPVVVSFFLICQYICFLLVLFRQKELVMSFSYLLIYLLLDPQLFIFLFFARSFQTLARSGVDVALIQKTITQHFERTGQLISNLSTLRQLVEEERQKTYVFICLENNCHFFEKNVNLWKRRGKKTYFDFLLFFGKNI
jgi:hypothetical protein